MTTRTTWWLWFAALALAAVPACSSRDRNGDDDDEADGDADADADGDADGDTDADGDGDGDADGYNVDDPVEGVVRVDAGGIASQTAARGEHRTFRLDLPQGTHAMFEVLFSARDGDIDLILYDDTMNELQRAESGTNDERVSAYDPDRNRTFYLELFVYDGDSIPYDLGVALRPLDISTPACRDDDCDALMQLPAPIGPQMGYYADERAEYHFARKSLFQAFMFATRQVYLEAPDTGPLGVTQVGDAQGRIPGVKVGEQWHPDGTHTDGLDMDSAYYRTDHAPGQPNEGGYICVDEICEVSDPQGCYASGGNSVDYFCDSTSDHWVDAERMARYYGHLFESGIIRVIGADRIVVQDILDAADRLYDAGEMSDDGYDGIMGGVACQRSFDECWRGYWAFHVHHTHISTDR